MTQNSDFDQMLPLLSAGGAILCGTQYLLIKSVTNWLILSFITEYAFYDLNQSMMSAWTSEKDKLHTLLFI